MTGIERVKRAISFQQPDRLPMIFFNRDLDRSDMVMIDVQQHFGGKDGKLSEWGFHWSSVDQTMGQPMETLLKNWEDLDGFSPPQVKEKERIGWLEKQKALCSPGQYLLGSLQLSGFTVMTFLRGFANVMEDFYLEEERLNALADLVFGFEQELIRLSAKAGLHGVAFFDDWGTQESLMISPALWEAFFMPRYQAQFSLAHSLGLDVYFHSCGQISDLIGRLFDAGVGMLNLSQPNLYSMPELGRTYGGKGCFVIPVSYQSTLLTGTREEIFRDVQAAYDALGSQKGGLIGYLEDYSSLGMSEENYRACIEAFACVNNIKNL